MARQYLIEEAAAKAYFAPRPIPKRLWKWLQDDGPIIRADALATLPGGLIRFRSPSGMMDLPRDMVTEVLE